MPRPPISGGNWPGRRPGVASRDVLPFIACAIIVCTAAWLVPPERAEPRAGEVEARLAAELDSRIGLLTAWQRDRRSSLEAIADAEELRTRVRQANDRAEIARHLARACLGFEGCAVHASGGRLIADFQNRESPEELVLRAGTGRTSQGGVVSTDPVGRPVAQARSEWPRERWSIHFATPIFDGGRVAAVLVGRARADRQLDPLLCRRRPGRTGETYLVAPTGYMVTPSRFPVRQRAASGPARVLQHPAMAMLDHSDELERTVRDGALHRRGIDVNGYPDYRGVRVVGAWQWLDDLGASVITEMDAAEVFLR